MTLTNLAIVVAIAWLESGGNPRAYNPAEQAYGWHQIRQPALDDVNRHFHSNIELRGCLDPEVSSWVMLSYCHLHGAKTVEDYANIVRAGPGGKAPKEYVERLKNLMVLLTTPRKAVP